MSQYYLSTVGGLTLKMSRAEARTRRDFPGSLVPCPQDVIRGVKVSPRRSPEDDGRINRSLKIESLSCHVPR